MKNTFIKILSFIAIFGIVSFASAHVASANYSINTASNDCHTVTIGNFTTGNGITDPCWTATTMNASAGDVVKVAIYYHNAGNSDAQNVSFRLTDPRNQTINGSTSFTGTILVNGSEVASGIVALNVTGGPAQLTLSQVANYTQASSSNQPVANGSDIFSSQGLNIGTVAPGWNTQGAIKVSFNVVSANNCTSCGNGQQPTIATYPAMVNSANGSAILKGYFNSNNLNTTTSFQYRYAGGSWITGIGSINQYMTYGNMQYQVNNLPAGTYDYEAVATNSAGTAYGVDVPFTIGNNNNTTCPVNYVWNNGACVPIVQNCSSYGINYVWSNGSCVYQAPNQNCGYNQYWTGSYCANYSTNNCSSYGLNYSWNGYSCVYQNNQVTTSAPSVTTLGTISVNPVSAAVDGYFSNNGCQATTYFQYGTNAALGQTTGSVIQSATSGSMAQALTGLAPGTTYYYRAVAQNCAGTNYGTTNSFATPVGYGNNTTNTNTTTNVITTIGGGNAFLQLTIDNNETTVPGGTPTSYNVSWKNISGSTLQNIVLEINFPSQMTITNPGMGSVEPGKSSVIYHITSLASQETGQMTVIGQINSGMKQGDPVVAQAVAAFQKGTATENAITYDADTFNASSSVLGASIFGLNFLPNSLGGWLIILFIILIIIIIAHYYFVGRHQNAVVVHTAPAPMSPVPENLPTSDYTVYRPNPKQ